MQFLALLVVFLLGFVPFLALFRSPDLQIVSPNKFKLSSISIDCQRSFDPNKSIFFSSIQQKYYGSATSCDSFTLKFREPSFHSGLDTAFNSQELFFAHSTFPSSSHLYFSTHSISTIRFPFFSTFHFSPLPFRYGKSIFLQASYYASYSHTRLRTLFQNIYLHRREVAINSLFNKRMTPRERRIRREIIRLFGPGYSSDNSGDGPTMPKISPTDPKTFTTIPLYSSTDFAQWVISFTTLVPQSIVDLIGSVYDTPDAFTPSAAQSADTYTVNYNQLNRNLFVSLYYAVEKSGDSAALVAISKFHESKDGLAAWKALNELNYQNTVQSKLSLLSSLLRCHQLPGEDILAFKNRLHRIHHQVQQLNVSVDDLIATQYIIGLAPEHSAFVTSLLAGDPGILTLEEVYVRLRNHVQATSSRQDIAKAHFSAPAPASSSSSDAKLDQVISVLGNLASNSRHKFKPSGGKGGIAGRNKNKPVAPTSTTKVDTSKLTDPEYTKTLGRDLLNLHFPSRPAPHERKFTCKTCNKLGHGSRTCHQRKTTTTKASLAQVQSNPSAETFPPAPVLSLSASSSSSSSRPPLPNGPPHPPHQVDQTNFSDASSSSSQSQTASGQVHTHGRHVSISDTQSFLATTTRTSAYTAAPLNNSSYIRLWADSGASEHMVGKSVQRADFSTYSPDSSVTIGTMSGPMNSLGRGTYGSLNFLHTPGEANLLSIPTLSREGFVSVFDKNGYNLYDPAAISIDGAPILTGTPRDGLYEVTIPRDFFLSNSNTAVSAATASSDHFTSAMLTSIVPENPYTLLHNRLAHPSVDALKTLRNKSLYYNYSLYFSNKHFKAHQHSVGLCDGCAKGKMHNHPIRRRPLPSHRVSTREPSTNSNPNSRVYKPGELIVADLLISNAPSLNNSTCALVLMDAGSRYVWVYPMQSKDQAASKLREWGNEMKARRKAFPHLTTVRSDNGGEFTGAEWQSVLTDFQILQEYSPPYMHVYLAERLNLTLREMTRSMLYYQNVQLGFWAEAITYAAYILNRTTTKANPKFTRYELFHGTKPSLNMVRTFGCPVYARAYDDQTKKWDPRAWPGIFVNLDEKHPLVWKIYNPSTGRMYRTSNVVFDERVPRKEGNSDFAAAVDVDNLFIEPLDLPLLCGEVVHVPATIPNSAVSVDLPAPPVGLKRGSHISEGESITKRTRAQMNPRRSERISAKHPSAFFVHDEGVNPRCLTAHELITPNHPRDISTLDPQHQTEWEKSIASEISSIDRNETFWGVLERPQGVNILPHKWVFRIKTNSDGSIARYKSRCTSGGHRQKHGIDYDETFAPVVRYSTVRTLLAVAASRNLHLHQMDVDTAFLYGELSEDDPDVFMEVPEFYPIPEQLQHIPRNRLCVKLRKTLYGLKQAPRKWYNKLNTALEEMGFTRSAHDPCLYIKGTGDNTMYVTVFVDDLVIACKLLAFIDAFKADIATRFNMKDMGVLSYFLGMEVRRGRDGTITLSQQRYASDILKRFGMSECNPISCPFPNRPDLVQLGDSSGQSEIPSFSLGAPCAFADDDVGDMEDNVDRYRAIVGSLMYLMVSTRPDLSFAVGYLARYLNKHDDSHLKAAHNVLRYLQGTLSMGIVFKSSVPLDLVGYSDSDWASDLNTRRSTTGYLF